MTCRACVRTDTRPYLTGDRCPDHTPAATAGRPEPDTLLTPGEGAETVRRLNATVSPYDHEQALRHAAERVERRAAARATQGETR